MSMSRQKKGNSPKKPAGPQTREAPSAPQEEVAPRPEGPDPASREPLRPSITVSAPDDSFYQGSLYAVTGEGEDPCHEEQLGSLSPHSRPEPEPPETEVPGLALSWTGEEIVRGFVMSEILNRKT